MRILFVLKDSLIHERLGVMYLSSSLKTAGHTVRLVLAGCIGVSGLKRIMDTYLPSVVGYSAMTGEHVKLLEINRMLKKDYQFLSVFGGPHATFSRSLIKEDGCDAACVGEGEVSFVEFCNRFERKEDYWRTPNFITKYNGDIIINTVAPLVANLDLLPFPDRNLMYKADPPLMREGRKLFFFWARLSL